MIFQSLKRQKYKVFFVLFFVSSFFLYSQDQTVVVTEETTSIQDENEILFDEAGAVEDIRPQNLNTSSSIWILVRIVLVLLLVCVAIYAFLSLIKKQTKSIATDDPYLKSVAFLPLSTNKSVQVITLGEQAFLLGVCDASISLLSEITNKELIDTMTLSYDTSKPRPSGTFASLLSLLTPKKTTNELQNESINPTDFIRTVRERLKKSSQDVEK